MKSTFFYNYFEYFTVACGFLNLCLEMIFEKILIS